MRTMKFFAIAGLILGLFSAVSQSDEPKKKTIKQVMQLGHQSKNKDVDPLCKMVVTGKATADQKKELLSLYEDMAAAKAPKGDADSWTKKTTAIVAAAKDVVAGKKGAEETLGEAINCRMCHTIHRPAKP